MTKNEQTLYRIAAGMARSDQKITKAFARDQIRVSKFQKDEGTQKTRTEVVCNLATEFRGIRLPREQARQRPEETPLFKRLEFFKRQRFLNCVRQANFRTATAGEHHTFVYITDGEPKALSVSTEGRKYSSLNSWRRTDTEHRYFIPRLWYTQVQAKGIGLLDGLMTLCAGPKETHVQDAREIDLYPATWVGQGKWFSLTTEKGWIARLRSLSYHAPTRESAIQGVLQKQASRFTRLANRIPKFELAENLFGHFQVMLEDSLEVGNCKSGTIAWCYRVGIDPEKPVTLAQVIRGFRVESGLYPLRVIRRVIDKATTQPLDSRGKHLVGLN